VGEEEDHVAPPLEHAEAFSLVPIQGDEGPSEISCFLVGFSPLVNMGLFSIFSYVNEWNKWGGAGAWWARPFTQERSAKCITQSTDSYS
jgi:hypothetical protein